MTPEEAIQYFNDEIRLCRAAPSINGCQMTENWQRTIDACEIAVAAIRKVQELEQAEHDGRLVMLPCKVGDTLFDTYFGDIREKEVVSVGFMLSKSVKHMTIHANNFRGAITEIEIDRIGKEIFYTREEAEAALKGGEV